MRSNVSAGAEPSISETNYGLKSPFFSLITTRFSTIYDSAFILQLFSLVLLLLGFA